jgi:hypothetical protein
VACGFWVLVLHIGPQVVRQLLHPALVAVMKIWLLTVWKKLGYKFDEYGEEQM